MVGRRGETRRSRESGYTLVAIMIFITLLSIAILAVSPSVSMMMRRDREQELLFRGRQYAQAILNFQKRQGRFPLKLAELMKTQPRSARQLYKEPICNCDDWGLIRVGQPWPPPKTSTNPADGGMFGGTDGTTTSAAPPPSSGPGPAFGSPGGGQTRPGAPVPTTYTTPPPGGTGSASGTPQTGTGGDAGNDSGGLDLGGDQQPQTNVPIIGVYSKIHQKGLQTFHGQEYYDQWGFIAGANNDPDLPGSLPAGFPGIPNRPPGVTKPPATSPGTSSGSTF
jgi:type II secretory pathway pseudopilin PulG